MSIFIVWRRIKNCEPCLLGLIEIGQEIRCEEDREAVMDEIYNAALDHDNIQEILEIIRKVYPRATEEDYESLYTDEREEE